MKYACETRKFIVKYAPRSGGFVPRALARGFAPGLHWGAEPPYQPPTSARAPTLAMIVAYRHFFWDTLSTGYGGARGGEGYGETSHCGL